jgi:hypothetical protein
VSRSRTGLKLLACRLRGCLADLDEARGDGYDEEKFERLFLMLT